MKKYTPNKRQIETAKRVLQAHDRSASARETREEVDAWQTAQFALTLVGKLKEMAEQYKQDAKAWHVEQESAKQRYEVLGRVCQVNEEKAERQEDLHADEVRGYRAKLDRLVEVRAMLHEVAVTRPQRQEQLEHLEPEEIVFGRILQLLDDIISERIVMRFSYNEEQRNWEANRGPR